MPAPSNPIFQIAIHCGLDEQRHVARGLLILISDPEAEREFTSIAAGIKYHLQEIDKLAKDAKPNIILSKGLLDKSNKTALAAMLIEVSRSNLNRDIAGERARRYLAALAVEIVSRNPSCFKDEAIAVLGRMVRHEISSGTKHSAIPDPKSLLGLIGWMNGLRQDTTKFTAEFWRYWRKSIQDDAWKIVNTKEYEDLDTNQYDLDQVEITTILPEPGENDYIPNLIIIPEPKNDLEKGRSAGIHKVVSEALQSTYTPLHTLSESSTTFLTDEEVKKYVENSLIDIDKSWAVTDKTECHAMLGRLVILVTGTSANKIPDLVWIDIKKERPVKAEGITIDYEWFIRREYVPDNSFAFDNADQSRAVWIPIPIKLQKWLREVNSNPKHLQIIFDSLRGSLPVVRQSTVSDTALRRTFFSRIARLEPLGITGAQWACGDNFGIDISPLYYDRYPADALARLIENVTFPWFLDNNKINKSKRSIPKHYLGSRVPNDKKSYSDILSQAKHDIQTNHSLNEKIAYINKLTHNLVHGIVIATGHRPNNNFNKLTLKSFDLVQGVGMISDKAVDPSWQHRPVCIPEPLCNEIAELVSELELISVMTIGTTLGQWSKDAISGAGPLFIKINSEDSVESYSKNDYLQYLPNDLLECDNFARHWLNQYLTGKVSEMLRVGQLGWHGTRAGSWSDLSPLSVSAGCLKLNPVLSQYLVSVGWRPLVNKSNRINILPININWMEEEHQHERNYRSKIDKLHQTSAEKNSILAREMLPELRLLVDKKWPSKFSVDDRFQLQWIDRNVSSQTTEAVTYNDIEQMARALTPGDSRRLVRAIAFNLITLIFRMAKKRGLVSGKIPNRKGFMFGSGPGPFLKCSPMALVASRHLEDWLMNENCPLSLPARTVVALLHFSGYTNIENILSVLKKNVLLVRTKSNTDVILAEPENKRETMAFNGMAVLHLMRWHKGRKGKIPDISNIKAEIYKHLPIYLKPDSEDQVLDQLTSLARIRNSLEMDGIARLVGTDKVKITTTQASRIAELHDDLPVGQTGLVDCNQKNLPSNATGDSKKNKNINLTIRSLTSAISKCQIHNTHSKNISEAAARESLRNWLIEKYNSNKSNVQIEHLLARFAIALIDKGIEKDKDKDKDNKRAGLQFVTILGYIGVIAHALKRNLGSDPLSKSQEQWQEAYLKIIASSTPDMRIRKRDALSRFHSIVGSHVRLPIIDFVMLSKIAGDRTLFVNPGYLTRDMKEKVAGILKRDIADLDTQNASAEELHEAKARNLYFYLLCSTTLRPREAWSFAISDVKFLNDSTYITVRPHGFQKIKTVRARRRVMLRGGLAAEARIHLSKWLEYLQSLHGSNYNSSLPVFSDFGDSSKLIERSRISGRVNELIRWVANDAEAVAYWARKSDIYSSANALQSGSHESLWPARDLLARAGHAKFITTLGSYIHDPFLVFRRWFKEIINHLKIKDIGVAIGRSSRYIGNLNTKSARVSRIEDIRLRISALLDDIPIVNNVVNNIHLPRNIICSDTFHPTISDMDLLIRSVASGIDVNSAALLRSWPSQSIVKLEQALLELSTYGLSLQNSSSSNILIKPPRLINALNMTPGQGYDLQIGSIKFDHITLREMADSWVKYASFIRVDKGIPGTPLEWSKWEVVVGSLSSGAWSKDDFGRLECRLPSSQLGVTSSAWPMIRWNLTLYWILHKI